MVCESLAIHAPTSGHAKKPSANRCRALVPQSNDKLAPAQGAVAKSMPHSDTIEELVLLMATAQTVDRTYDVYRAKDDVVSGDRSKASILSGQDCCFQGMPARALLKTRSKIDVAKRDAMAKAHDLKCRPERHSNRSQKSDYVKNGSSSVAQWTIKVDRSSGLPLGMHVDVASGQIHSVKWNGLIGAWNLDNPGKELRTGDKIKAVNGRCEIDAIVAECSKSQELLIDIERVTQNLDVDTEHQRFSVEIVRSCNTSLGVAVDPTTSEVLSVSWNGLLGEWNIDHPDQQIKPGDKIVKVNGRCAIEKIIEQCQKQQPLHIVVESTRRKKVQTKRTNRRQGLIGAWNVD